MSKKYILFWIGVFWAALAQAQIVTTEPEQFSAVEPVTITVDVTGTAVEGVEPLYVWAWVPGCCDSPTNGEWTNSNEANRMTKVADNVWSFSMSSLRDFYRQTPGAIGDQIGFLVKAKDGTGDIKTADQLLPVEPPRFVESDFRTFPANFSQQDVVTLFYDQTLDNNDETNNLSEYYLYATATLSTNETVEPYAPEEVGDTPELRLTDLGGGTFRISMIPSEFFGLNESDNITSITIVIRSKDDPDVALDPRVRLPFDLKEN